MRPWDLPSIFLLWQPKFNPTLWNSTRTEMFNVWGVDSSAGMRTTVEERTGTARRERARRALSSRDGLKNTPAQALEALSKNKSPKHIRMFLSWRYQVKIVIYTARRCHAKRKRGKGVTTGWFSFIVWFVSQKLPLPLCFFSSLKEGKFKRNCRRRLKI